MSAEQVALIPQCAECLVESLSTVDDEAESLLVATDQATVATRIRLTMIARATQRPLNARYSDLPESLDSRSAHPGQ